MEISKSPCRIKDIHLFKDKTATIGGWIRHIRSSGKIIFIVLRDGSGLIQVVIEKSRVPEEVFDKIKHLGIESAIMVTGPVREDKRAPGGYEINADKLEIIQEVKEYPISPKPHGIDFLMKRRHLWLRSPRQLAIMKIRDSIVWAIREFFRKEGFILVDTPILSATAGEGAATLFNLDYFGKQAYLAQTGQLYLEAAAMAAGRVYCFGPTFRAEKSKTRRHLTEFWMVEPELIFVDLDGLIELAENLITYIVEYILEHHRKDLETLERDTAPLEKIKPPFYRITYDEAVSILNNRAEKLLLAEKQSLENRLSSLEDELSQLTEQDQNKLKSWQQEKIAGRIIEIRQEIEEIKTHLKNIPNHIELAKNFRWGNDLGGSDETIISKLHDKPVFITHYPKEAKAFYMRQCRTNPSLVENFDLLAPEGVGEIIGGSVREEDYNLLLDRMKQENMPIEPYQWYLDIRRFGSVPHGGFGLGIERTICWICGLRHVREAIAFPRLIDNIYP